MSIMIMSSSNSTAEIRKMFLDFFYIKGHTVIPSSSLVPYNDPTLLLTNAGMNQFKDVFLGLDKRPYSRATTVQRCVRAGGKHNDLEQVGYTNHHHTFFEMLGNFSFGDYFKDEAIKYAWELLTSDQWFALPADRLLITVYYTDDESYNIWHQKIGIPTERIIRIGDNNHINQCASENFWQMGDTGPCGPCTEILYDRGSGGHIAPKLSSYSSEFNDRYVEIWNIVFMQFNRESNGKLKVLSTPSVDTGMGLERIAAVLQEVNSNYEIDLFRKLITDIASIIQLSDINNKSLQVIADHIRSSAFLIGDGVFPANEGCGYVLRRIIRRAVRHGYIIGINNTFLYKLVAPLIQVMGQVADELKSKQTTIEQILKHEEEQFSRTLVSGLNLLNNELSKLKNNTLSGQIAFRLYDTYGFPLDLTVDICRERNIKVDELGFNLAIEQQRYRSRYCSKFLAEADVENHYTVPIIKDYNYSNFLGYEYNNHLATVIAIVYKGTNVNILNQGEEGIIILNKTTFYAESGGQIGDIGILINDKCQFIVTDTKKYAQLIGHIGKVNVGRIAVNNILEARIDVSRRNAVSINHSATHLLHASLRKILGNHVTQKGSLVHDKYLRFDFFHFEMITAEQIYKIENMVNDYIRKNIKVITTLMDLKTAKEKGAIALFNEKYSSTSVRVINISNFSIELCSGTHAKHTGDIGLFIIKSESSIATGIRRIEAITGKIAIDYVQHQSMMLDKIRKLMKVNNNNLIEKIKTTLEKNKLLEKSLNQLKEKEAIRESIYLPKKAKKINGINLLITQLNEKNPKQLRIIVDNLKKKLKSVIIVLSTINNNKAYLIVGISNDLTDKLKATDLISFIAQQIGGKGGGSSALAQASGYDLIAIPTALASVEEWINLYFM